MKKIDLQTADKNELFKYAKSVVSKASRRIRSIKRAGFSSHVLDNYIARREEVLGDRYQGNYSTVSKNFTENQLKSIIASAEDYLENPLSSITAIRERIHEFTEMFDIGEKLTKTEKSDILKTIDNVNDSASDIKDILGSETIRKIYQGFSNGNFSTWKDKDGNSHSIKNGRHLSYILSKYYEDTESKDVSIDDLSNIFGVDLS